MTLNQLLPYLDFINIGMKGFTDERIQGMWCAGNQTGAPKSENPCTTRAIHIEISCMSYTAEIKMK